MMRLAFATVCLAAFLPTAQAQTCRTLETEMTPSDGLQIVVWLGTAGGDYVDTLFITNQTGRYGMGNRPGHMGHNSAWAWPYGRRTTTFPIWAHRHGMSWPLVVFQNEDEKNLSHPLNESSSELHYCRPLKPDEEMWDTQTCASVVKTDKGKLSTSDTSLYPPRMDIGVSQGVDDPAVADFASMNPFDAVSRATPPAGEAFKWTWLIPATIQDGDYIVYVEVSKEFDQNATYDYPALQGIPWSQYGLPYRGQPSVLYSVPLKIEDGKTHFGSVLDYSGYGDPDGLDGNVRQPDATISTGTAGSGASRLLLTDDNGEMFRVRASSVSSDDASPPEQIAAPALLDLTHETVSLSFIEPEDDQGVTSYEVRYIAGETLTDANWDKANVAPVMITPQGAGTLQSITVPGLLPQTNYSIGIRARDQCLNQSTVASFDVATDRRPVGSVDACFIATAAYGTIMANDVVALRGFRDSVLRQSMFGEVAVEVYYTFGPSLAVGIDYVEPARTVVRNLLSPAIATAKRLSTVLQSRHDSRQ